MNADTTRILAAAANLEPAQARAVVGAILAADSIQNPKSTIQNAFETAMQPVSDAIAGALQDGDLKALQGLRAMLPGLLHEVNASGVLQREFAAQLGAAIVEGFAAGEDAP